MIGGVDINEVLIGLNKWCDRYLIIVDMEDVFE